MLKLKPNYYKRWCIIRWLIRMVFNCIRKLSCIEHFFKLEPASAFWKVPRQLLLLQSPHFYDQGHIGLGAFSINRFEHTSQPFHSSFFLLRTFVLVTSTLLRTEKCSLATIFSERILWRERLVTFSENSSLPEAQLYWVSIGEQVRGRLFASFHTHCYSQWSMATAAAPTVSSLRRGPSFCSL